MQGVRKHTAIFKMRGRSNYSLLPGVFAPISSTSMRLFGTLKFGHVEIRTLGGRLPQRPPA
jgi:hypothetical protein